MVTSTRARFGQFVHRRRRLLNLTQDEVTAAGGPSDAAQTRAENGTGPDPSIETLRKLDVALRWAPGSAARTLDGGHPTPLEALDGDDRSPTPRPLTLGPSEIPLDLDTIIEILGPHTQITKLSAAHPEVPGLAEAAGELSRVVSKITGAYVTRLLEVNGGPAGPRQPLVEFAFGHLLEEPSTVTDPRELEEARYRRFLYGRGEDLDAATRERFWRRWEDAVKLVATEDPERSGDAEVNA
ncbi:helix-turn-helix domain-containing protein [Rhodococcus opacus]|uniref:DNA-binding protein n=1 Tax=Rhodococcus opacus TaxID=37919 RepID=A0A076EK45_RHOOP|nr:helix-turn-helix domain-containing protein [Rhodococcus opacus]AII05597.1 DNA-binding protein [Rhodococcus opacus]